MTLVYSIYEVMEVTPEMQDLFDACPRFDEGDAYQTEAYQIHSTLRNCLLFHLNRRLDDDAREFLSDLLDFMSDETDFECWHYFQEGYRMGRESR